MTRGVKLNVQAVLRALTRVREREYGRSIVHLGLVRGVAIREGGRVVVDMTLTRPDYPYGLDLVWEVRRAVSRVVGVRRVDVELAWGARWEAPRAFPGTRTTPWAPAHEGAGGALSSLGPAGPGSVDKS